MSSQTTEELLAQRQTTHGEYADHAMVTQGILAVLAYGKNYSSLNPMIAETLHMIAHKLGRIVTGNPHVKDHYDDIAGYAKLISQRLTDGSGIADDYNRAVFATMVSTKKPKTPTPSHVQEPITPTEDIDRILEDLPNQRRGYAWVREGTEYPSVYEPVMLNGEQVARRSLTDGVVEKLYAKPAEPMQDYEAAEYKPGTPEDGGHHARQEEPPSISLPDGVTLSDDCKFWLSSKYRMPDGWMWDTDEGGGLVWGINNTVRVRPA